MSDNENKKNEDQNVINLGCRLNSYESSVIDKIIEKTSISGKCIVVNTCAVTAEAERKSRQAIRKIKKQYPDKKIIVTGCAAQINPEQFTKMPEVEKVIGNDIKTDDGFYEKLSKEWSSPLQISSQKAQVNDIMSIRETANHLFADTQNRSRAFLQIQNGCNHRCTFCIIPFGRGNSRSVPVAQVVNHIKELIASGYNEVVLTGVDITDYGLDLPAKPSLGNLCKRILATTDLKRLRLSSVDVAEIDEDLIDLIKTEPRLMPYFHISLQSGDGLILKRMKRRHTPDDVVKFCDLVRSYRADVGFGADIICGFPTETDEMFENTLKLVEKCQIQYIHAFTYSARNGTPAAKMPQVKLDIRKRRTSDLIALGDRVLMDFSKSLIGKAQSCVVEADFTLRSENFAKITPKDKSKFTSLQVGSIISVICTDIIDGEVMCD
ncbi:tRNA (N(6)-L-threonylcarbamoyladenosine(37)-C(2))-methylthiotransferase MtaB [Candidatus Deianiraea vastatrix]|uniref:Threonylcarbamoyladenosine tRNA methylthiotransferase MtaB n=1 Tax=Candidatus Deianiraea vastatrix TaxID=2163644 RepID=A0A5B8XG16_9RICK|nr:tRNA (N(6)-L-threonylcarbamoyladenosine(37)-C(2))-methylthiotransferase MtaB [Candidatus Deianiraea vastatrix]QED23849.1 Threonylcarbamoyladenosine tRNA methylthiotransferase MtaB [Candidatus Deianiraea vastatrix]